jgi:hypothetical protein
MVSKRGKIYEPRRHGSGSIILDQCGSVPSSGFRVLMTKNCKSLQLKEKTRNFCGQKLQFMKDHQCYRRSHSPLRRTCNFLIFFYFFGQFCPPGSRSESAFPMRIRTDRPIKINADPVSRHLLLNTGKVQEETNTNGFYG